MKGLRRIGTLYQVFGPYVKPYARTMTFAYLALIASVVMALARPWPLKLILDSVILGKVRISETVPFVPAALDLLDKHLLLILLAASLVVIVLIESTFGYFQKVWFSSVGHSATTDVMEHVFTHLQMLPRSTGETRTGDVMVRVTSDIKTLRNLLVNHAQKLGTYGLTFISTLTVMFVMNWQLSLLGLLVVPFIWLASYFFAVSIRAATKQKRKKEGDVASIVQETLTSINVVQAFAQEEAERRRFRTEARESLDANIESAKLGGAFTRTIQVLNTIGAALVVWLGATRVLEGQMSPGDLVVFAAYIAELYTPIQNMSELSVQFMESLVSGERVLDLMQTAPRIRDSKRAIAAPPFRGDIRFEDVSFGYTQATTVLKNLSFHIEPGETVALVGGSGAGKSTIINLLLRFYDPAAGRILIDGHDIREYRLQSLRSQIGVVLQEPVLFRRTIRENIAYGRPHAADAEIEAAARAAHAHEFIMDLPDGYETVMDERGANLSGGQRQRITIARAYLRHAPILVLDEPTSGLDSTTEALFSETLETLAKGRTTLIIAHRFTTVARADRVLVLEAGRIVQEGCHAALLAVPGRYRELYEAPLQTGV